MPSQYVNVSGNAPELTDDMTTIDFNSLKGIPTNFLDELKAFNSLFSESRFLEHLLQNNSSIVNLIERINTHCLKNKIFGFHYTKAIPEEIRKNGLTCRKGEDIRIAFMKRFGHHFTNEEKLQIKNTWNNHFDSQQQELRDNKLFFNFTTIALEEFGAQPLLSNFGGEQVYMPIQELKGVGCKIKNIGKPLILKCTLDPSNINTFYEHPWGRIAMSSYHCKVNEDAFQDDQDGYQKSDVKPENIQIIKYKEGRHYS